LLGLACTPTGLEFYWIYTDPIGFPVAMTNTPATPSQAKVIWRASYEPFGLATEELDPDGDGKQVRMPMRFPGQWWDFATNLHDNYFRTFDPTVGRYLEADPIGQLGGINVYEYADSNPTNAVDPYGLYSSLQVQLAIGNFLTGVADAASLGLGPLARDALAPYGWGGYVDPCSTAYDAGGWASLGLGVGRLGYAAAAKGVSRFASSGAAASAGRNTLKRIFRGGAFPNYRNYSYANRLAKYGSDDAARAKAGQTNPWWNAAGANGALGSAANCGCDKAGGSGNGGHGAAGGNGGNDLAGQFLGGLGALHRR
jgi:RHS repeat-associated protein